MHSGECKSWKPTIDNVRILTRSFYFARSVETCWLDLSTYFARGVKSCLLQNSFFAQSVKVIDNKICLPGSLNYWQDLFAKKFKKPEAQDWSGHDLVDDQIPLNIVKMYMKLQFGI